MDVSVGVEDSLEDSSSKTVLICINNRNRPVPFTGGLEELRRSVLKVFKDVVNLSVESELIIQYRCEEWGGGGGGFFWGVWASHGFYNLVVLRGE